LGGDLRLPARLRNVPLTYKPTAFARHAAAEVNLALNEPLFELRATARQSIKQPHKRWVGAYRPEISANQWKSVFPIPNRDFSENCATGPLWALTKWPE
jgi:hypothetical protein